MKNDDKRPSVAARFCHVCLLFLSGVVALSLSLQLLARLWGWLALIAAIAGLVWLSIRIIRRRTGGW